MNAKIFFDTNILVYAHCLEDAEKCRIALDMIEDGFRYGIGVVSAQVLGEFYVTVTRKIQQTLAEAQAEKEVEFLSRFEVIEVDSRSVVRGIEFSRRYKLAYWDGLILASAERAGCRTLLTEDFSHG